jgi:hypothetical protein
MALFRKRASHTALLLTLAATLSTGCTTTRMSHDRLQAEWLNHMPAEEAQAILSNSDEFALLNSTNGAVSPQYFAFNVVYAQPDAAARFGALLSSPSIPAQLYGLMGLRVVDREAFDSYIDRYLRSSEAVTFLNGSCIPEPIQVSVVAQRLRDGNGDWLLATW